MAPTTKRLETLGFDADTARQVRGLIRGDIDPESFDSVSAWVGQCFNRPRRDELIMAALNEVLSGFGVESIRGRWVDGYHCDVVATYVNMGDTYALTVLLDSETGRYRVTSCGDWVERRPDVH